MAVIVPGIGYNVVCCYWLPTYNYRLLNEYSVLGQSSLVGIRSPSLRGDQSDQRTRYQNTVYESSITELLYTSIKCWIIDNY